jgi:hypothetical protein
VVGLLLLPWLVGALLVLALLSSGPGNGDRRVRVGCGLGTAAIVMVGLSLWAIDGMSGSTCRTWLGVLTLGLRGSGGGWISLPCAELMLIALPLEGVLLSVAVALAWRWLARRHQADLDELMK